MPLCTTDAVAGADGRYAGELAVDDVAARDGADLRHGRLRALRPVHLAADGASRPAMALLISSTVVNARSVVETDVHAFVFGHFLDFRRRTHVEPDDDGVGSRSQQDVGFRDLPVPPWMMLMRTFPCSASC